MCSTPFRHFGRYTQVCFRLVDGRLRLPLLLVRFPTSRWLPRLLLRCPEGTALVYGKGPHEKAVELLGITVVLGHARWVAAAAARHAGPSPGARLAPDRSPRGVRAAVAAAGGRGARAGARPRRARRHGPGPD